MGMTKFFGVAVATFLSTVQFAGAAGFEANEDDPHNSSDEARAERRLLLDQINELRHTAATSQELTDTSPVKQEQFSDLSFGAAAPVPGAGSFSLVSSESEDGGTGLGLGEAVTPVPLPTAGLLLLAGVGGLGLMRRKTRG